MAFPLTPPLPSKPFCSGRMVFSFFPLLFSPPHGIMEKNKGIKIIRKKDNLLESSMFFLSSFICVIWVLGSIAGMIFSAIPEFHVIPFVLCLLLFAAFVIIALSYYYKTHPDDEESEEPEDEKDQRLE